MLTFSVGTEPGEELSSARSRNQKVASRLRTVEANTNLHEELAAPFDASAHFRFYVDGSATAQTAVPSPVTDIRGFELHMTAFNQRSGGGGAAEETPLVTSIFFKNR